MKHRIHTRVKPQFYRDLWALGPSDGLYPGSFPRGFMSRVKKRWWGEKRLWLFSGSHADPHGVMVDIKPETNPTVAADCQYLPFPDESFDFVMADPPYSEEEAARLYNLPYINLLKVMNEAARVCKPGGFVLLLHRLIPFNHPESSFHLKRLKIVAVVGIYKIGGWSNIIALTVWYKHRTLESFTDTGVGGSSTDRGQG